MIKPEEIWWRRVPIAANFIEQCISEAKEFIPSYVHSDSLPWADQFLRITKRVIRDKSQDFKVYTVNGADFDPARHLRILDLMVEQIGGFSDYDSTIESIGVELNSRMIFFLVKAVSEAQLIELKNIAWEAKEHDIYLRLIVQTDIESDQVPETKYFRYFTNDINFFILNLLLEKNSTDLLTYKAWLATLLSVHDAEKAAACCKEIDNCVYDPQSVCTWLSAQQVTDLEYKAQLRYIMPELESARLNFCRKIKSGLSQKALPYSERISGTEYVYNRVEELEFRHLWFFHRKVNPCLTLPQDEKDQLEVLYNARNDLAHLRKLDVQRLIDVKKICDDLEKCARV